MSTGTQAIQKRTESAVQVKDLANNSIARLNMRELKELATIFVESGAFNDTKQVAQAMVKIIAGQELGFSPIVSMTGIHFFQGKVAIGSNLMASLIKESPKYDYEIIEHSSVACAVQFYSVAGQRVKLGVPVRYTIEEARDAGLLAKDTWKKYPSDLLFAAVMRQGTRRHCADVLRGLTADSDTAGDHQIAEIEAETPADEPETIIVNGDVVDNETGEVIEERLVVSSQQSVAEPETREPSETETVVTLKAISELLKVKCGDGEMVDEDRAKAFLKGRDPSVMPPAALRKLLDELRDS